MIIAVSIVDKHKPAGERHVGTYHFEIPYDGNSHFDLYAVACPVENEWIFRHLLGRLAQRDEIPEPMHPDGRPA